IKGELLLLRRMLWPQREVINALIREEGPDIDEDIKVYYRDCYDHTIQIIDLLETYRDMTTSMLDLYLSSVSNRLNEIMRVLTVIATIFIPLTFIVGVYGMNFGNDNKSPWAMPELRWYYGYPLVWLVMIVIAVVMLIIFKRRNWF
ncbi:MAG: magnesium/cobalt transporter CorA, partial [Candidatus Thiodiazotropha sp.]